MKKFLYIAILLFFVSSKHSVAQTFATLGFGCNNKVYTIMGDISSNNIIYAGGVFDYAGGNPAGYIARWNGSSWSTLDSGMNYYVRSLIYFNNELYAGGGFNVVGSGANSVIAWGVAKWDGTTWSNVGNGIHAAGDGVYTLAVYQSELYAGGFFDTLSGFNPGRGIEKWNGTAWVPLGGAIGNGVSGAPGFRARALQVFNNDLYVGGTFSTADGIIVNNIAKWNGSSWSAISTGTNGDVHAFTVYNGELYVGGDFTIAGGVTVNHLAKLTGTTFTPVGGGTNGTVYGLNSYQNNLYVTGNYTTSGSVSTQNISRWDGTNWYNLSLGIDGLGGYCLTPFNGNLFVGGFFAVAGTVVGANSIALWNMPTGIEESNTVLNNIIVYPNPSNEYLKIENYKNNLKDLQINIFTPEGKKVFTTPSFDFFSNQTIELDIFALRKGFYFIQFSTDHGILTRKLIIE